MSKLYGNVLLDQLPPQVSEQLAPNLERIELEPLQILVSPSEAVPHAYFPESAIIAALAPLTGYHQLGLIGREGVINHAFPLTQIRMPWTMKVQVAGSAWRIDAKKLAVVAEHHNDLGLALLRATGVQQIQLVSAGWCAARGGAEARLASWLLMYFDRIDGNELRVTHDALALVVGMRRPTITDALHVMEGEGVIACRRNSIVLRKRRELLKISGPLYGFAEAEYQQVLGVDFRPVEPREASFSVPEIILK